MKLHSIIAALLLTLSLVLFLGAVWTSPTVSLQEKLASTGLLTLCASVVVGITGID